jgi:two-component system phosphate regulon sensor histidine kinase PhoR
VGLGLVLFALAATAAVAGVLAGALAGAGGSPALVVAVAFAAALLGGSAGVLLARRIEAALARLRDASSGHTAMPAAFRFAEIQEVARAFRTRLQEQQDRLGRLERVREDLAALLAAAGEGILLVSREGVITRANPAATRLLGMSPNAEGSTIDSTIRSSAVRGAIHGALAGGEPAATEHEVDGRRVFVLVEPAEPQGAVVSLVDLTEIRRLETARRDFVANASHELKTPLTSIRGYAETLQDETLPADMRRRFLDTIRQNAERLQGVVDDLLDLSRIEAGAWEPDTQPIRVAEAARDAWAGLEEPARGREARLSLGDGTDVEVLADPFALRQILTNLLDNALRHTPDPAVIRVLAGSEASSGRGPTHVRIEVVDDGAGIPSESVPRIFERFFRVDPARTGTSGGTGLGLAIVKHLVEHMGGQVNARSELGRGTTVGFTLPMAAPVRSPSTKGAPSALVSSGGAS